MGTIVINDDLRTMQIPDDIVLLGVESDDDVNKIPFQMPKEYCGFDLSTFEARINYMNANGDGDVYVVNDLADDGDNPSMMTFTWLVGRTACAYQGNTKFIVCLKKFADDNSGTVVQEFNTTVYSLPVLEGLETTEAVVQQNADIIEYLMNLMTESGTVDPNNYYTKAQTDALIPSALPNPEKLTINGTEYDGSEPVDITVEATSEVLQLADGALIHVEDAVPQAVESLALYDASNNPVASAQIAVTNKNLFRIDQIPASVTSKGITFTKNANGSITCNGTSSGTYAMTSVALDPHMFVVGYEYTVSSGKAYGFTYVQLLINYTDNTTDYIVSRNSSRTFTISKAVASCVASVQLTDSGVTVNNEVVWPMLEVGSNASTFTLNSYSSMTFDGTTMPVLPEAVSNLWANDNNVANIVMYYEADSVRSTVNDVLAEKSIGSSSETSTLTAVHDGNGTVTLFVG